MDIKIKRLGKTAADPLGLAQKIHAAVMAEADLSKRSFKEIKSFINKGQAYVLLKNGELVSFAFLSPMSSDVSELHCLWTKPDERKKSFGKLLTQHLENEYPTSVFLATFHEHVASSFLRKGYHQTHWNKLPPRARYSFFARRIKPHRLASIFRYYRKIKPIYLIKPYESNCQ